MATSRIAFLSAEYGFREAKDHHRKLRPADDAIRRASRHAHCIDDRARKPFVDVCLVGGTLYLDIMRHFIDLFQEDGFVTGSAAITEICAPIGVVRQQMTIWLNRSMRDASGDAGAEGRR